MPIVKLPNGTQLNFPDEMSEADMRAAIGRNFPEYAAPSESPGAVGGALSVFGQAVKGMVGGSSDEGIGEAVRRRQDSMGISAPESMGPMYDKAFEKVMAEEMRDPLDPRLARIAPADAQAKMQIEASRRHAASDSQWARVVEGVAQQSAREAAARQTADARYSAENLMGNAAANVRNVGAGALKIGPTALKGVFDIAQMLTGGTYGKDGSAAMVEGLRAIDDVIADPSLGQQGKALQALMADPNAGLAEMYDFLRNNPAILLDNAITTVGSMFLPAGAAKGAVAGARALGAGQKAAGAAGAAAIGTGAAQNAADTFTSDNLSGASLDDKYRAAAFSAGMSVLAGMAFRGGAEGEIARRMAGVREAAGSAIAGTGKAAAREAAQEVGEELGNAAGEAIGGADIGADNNTAKRLAFAGTLGAMFGAAAHVGGAGQQSDDGSAAADSARQAALSRWTTSGLSPTSAGARLDPRWADVTGQAAVPAPSIGDIGAAGSVDEAIAAAQAVVDHEGTHATAADIEALERAAGIDAEPEPADSGEVPIPAPASPSVWRRANDPTIAPPSRVQAPPDGIPVLNDELPGQPEIPTLTDEINQQTDRDWFTYPRETGTLGVPRAQMPQIKAEHRGAMVNFLNARGVSHEMVEVPAESLKPTQAEFSMAKVNQANDYVGGERSILTSMDGHVLDGHHQWMAAVESGRPVKTIRLNAPIQQLLETVREFPSATTAGGGGGTTEPATSPSVGRKNAAKKTAGHRSRERVRADNPFLAFLANHGVSSKDKADSGADRGRFGNPLVPGYGPVFRKNGLRLDELALAAQQAGFLSASDIESADDTGGTRKLADMIQRVIGGNEVIGAPGMLDTAGSVNSSLEADASNLGIDVAGKTADKLYDEVSAAYGALEARREATGAANVDEQELIERYADEIPASVLEDAQLDEDIPLYGGTPSNNLTDEEIDAIFGIKKEGGPRADRSEAEGSTTEPTSQGAEGTAAPGQGASDLLTPYSREDVLRRESADADRAKALEAERARIEAMRRRKQEEKEIRARQDASAENFQLGQSAEDGLSGQGGLFDVRPSGATESGGSAMERTQSETKSGFTVTGEPKTVTQLVVEAASAPEPSSPLPGQLEDLGTMFDQILSEEMATKPDQDLGDMFDAILAEEIAAAKPEPQAEPEPDKAPTGLAAEKAKLARQRKPKTGTAGSASSAKPKRVTKQQAAEQRVREALGAGIGDTITMTFKGNVGYLSSGKPMLIERIGSDGTVYFMDPKTGGRTSERLVMLQAFAQNKSTDLRWEVTPKDERGAGEAAVSAAKNSAASFAAAVTGLGEIFGVNTSKMGIVPFDETKYQRAAPHFDAAVAAAGAALKDIQDVMRAVVRSVLEKFGPATAANMRPYVIRYVEDYRSGKTPTGESNADDDTGAGFERDSGDRQDAEPAADRDIFDVRPAVGRDARQFDGGPDESGDGQVDSAGVPGRDAVDDRKAGDRGLPVRQSPRGPAASPAKPRNAGGSSDGGYQESQSQSDAIGEPATRLGARLSLDEKRRLQVAADSIPVIPGDRANITATLPYLLDGQRDDVFFAEARFANREKQPGVMFTNGTGTGKTFTGLGVAKRFERMGKGNGIIVVPNNQIAQDWIESGKALGLNIRALDSTTDNGGSGIVITTYANFGVNRSLAERAWDFVMPDEAHYLMASQDGTTTDALQVLRALTRHPDGFAAYSRMVNRDLFDQLQALGTADSKRSAVLWKQLQEREAAQKPEYAAVANVPIARPKVVFLSATPFAYVKAVDYAEGYLFSYGDGGKIGNSNQDGRAHFFVRHFGYRIRYHKLTEPDAEVDRGLMARQFNSWLKAEGALSGRLLDVEADYARRFIMVKSALGSKIDEGLEFIREHAEYKHLYQPLMKQFDYLSRRYLLEAIKAKEAIPIIQKHLDLGRKVVVVHDYKKGGAFNPFHLARVSGKTGYWDGNTYKEIDLAELAGQFKAERADLVNLELPSQSALQLLTAAFPDALIHNGDVPAKQLEQNKALFNSDDSSRRIILLQSDKGREGISLHDTTGRYQRVEVNIGLPARPSALIQLEGRIYRTQQVTNAIMDYLNTGTSWERYTFAQTIAERADIAEALAMGDLARTLKDSIVEAFENSAEHAITSEDGQGGKERDRAAARMLTEWDRAKSYYYAQLKRNSNSKSQEGTDYYATPEPLGLKMVEWADIRPGDDVLEPSAGHGAIARWFPIQSAKTIVEPETTLITRARMAVEGSAKFVQSKFEDLHLVNKYDVIVMNPPFGKAGSLAIPHLAKAYQHLREGGRIVALLPRGAGADAKFEKFLYGDKAPKDLYMVADIFLPSATFTRAGTGVMTRIVILDKTSEPIKAPQQMLGREYHHADDVQSLFDSIEYATVTGRARTDGGEDVAIEEAKPALAGVAPTMAAPLDGAAPLYYSQFEFDHTKTGEKVYGAAVVNRLSMDAYKEANTIAKKHGGWYSKYVGGGAQRGFLFKTAATRRAFMIEAGKLDEVRAGIDQQNSLTNPARDQLLAALGTGGRAEQFAALALSARVAPRIEKALRDGRPSGDPGDNGLQLLRGAVREISFTGPKPLRALARQVGNLLPTDGRMLLTIDDVTPAAANGSVTMAPLHLRLFTAQGRTGLTYETLLHEALHVAVAARYRSLAAGMERGNDAVLGLTAPAAAEALAQFDAVWNEYRDMTAGEKFSSPDLELSVLEARGNPDEFFVRALTDPLLQAYLASKRYEGKTLWQRLRDWIKTNLLGLSSDAAEPSWLEAAMTASSDVLDAMRGDSADFARMDALTREQLSRSRVQEDSLKFKRWFGDSKAVDAADRPKVMYHGTSRLAINGYDKEGTREQLDEFKPDTEGGSGAIYVTDSPEYADQYTNMKNPQNGGQMYPVYVKAERPFEFYNEGHMQQLRDVLTERHQFGPEGFRDGRADNYVSESEWRHLENGSFSVLERPIVRDAVQAAGFDSYFVREHDGGWSAVTDAPNEVMTLAVFSPKQIKSATGNNGNFDPNDPNIMFSRRPLPVPAWTAPNMTMQDTVIHTLQDKHVDMRKVVETIRSQAGQLEDKWDPYLQEELFHGRAATGFKTFLNDELRPLLEDMKTRGVTMEGLEEYLLMRHAEEANKRIASINPDMPDGGSGVDTADARAYLRTLPAAKAANYQALAARVDAIIKGTQQQLVDYGLEKQSTIDTWNDTYQHYVPLFREDTDNPYGGTGTGQGFSVRGPSSRRRTGSRSAVVDILANVAMARERAIVRGEKNRLDVALYGLALKAPNPRFWKPVNPQKNPGLLMGELVKMGLTPAEAQNVVDEPRQPAIDPVTGRVFYRANPLLRNAPNVVAVRINGEDRFVFFNTQDQRAMRMAISLKNIGNDGLNLALGAIATVTRGFAAINTQYNPVFGIVNLTRDLSEGAINLSATPLAGLQAEYAAETVRLFTLVARRGFRLDELTGADAALWAEFQKEGGITGYRQMFGDSSERARALMKGLNPDAWMESKWGKVFTAGGRMKVPYSIARRGAAPVFDWLSDYNEALENITRMAAFKLARAQGMTAQQSASLAKNLTVNFNRKGAVGQQVGALYAFFNASAQGTARMVKTLNSPAGRKIIGGGLLLGALQAVMMLAAGYDDEEPPEFIKAKNIIIPVGWISGKKDYVSVPLPLGFGFIPTIGRLGAEFALRGMKKPGKYLGRIIESVFDTFNPIGNGSIAQVLSPTAADPIVDLWGNRDWTGKPIAREDVSALHPTPGYTRAKDTASAIGKATAYYLNSWTGGTKYTPGAVSWTPDQIDYLLGQFTGGVGRELSKAQQTVSSVLTGEELPAYKVPLAGRFYGSNDDKSAVADKFYANLKELNVMRDELEGRAKDRARPREYLAEHPEALLADRGNAVLREISAIRKRKAEALEKGERVRVKDLELRMRKLMGGFNEAVEKTRSSASK